MININQTYIVKSGDTLYGISNQFGVSVTELAELNNIQGSFLQVGKELIIPSNEGTNPNNMFMYTVSSGDTLYSIARKYGISVDEIKKLNYFKNDNLVVGQVIRIPEMYFDMDNTLLPNYTTYTVKKGDTLYSIAKNNNIDVSTLQKDNALTDNNLTIGQVLKIRLKEGQTLEVEECFGQDYIPSKDVSTTQNYTVKKGDSLYKIANNYNTSVTNLINLNNLKNANLAIGQVIKVPKTTSNSYTVVKGDSLYKIANKFNTSVDEIKRKNNLVSNNLSIGQKLII